MTSQFEHRYFYVRETMIPVGIFAVPGRNTSPIRDDRAFLMPANAMRIDVDLMRIDVYSMPC